jgi:hypothetical protein
MEFVQSEICWIEELVGRCIQQRIYYQYGVGAGLLASDESVSAAVAFLDKMCGSIKELWHVLLRRRRDGMVVPLTERQVVRSL